MTQMQIPYGRAYPRKDYIKFFRKRAKRRKIFENLGKYIQNLKIFLKGVGDNHMQ